MGNKLEKQKEISNGFNVETIELIKNTVAPKNLTAKEFEMFIYQAQRTGLDPLSRQIYCIKNKDKVSIQSTIDGFRLIAERTGAYQGQTPVEWCGKDGVWCDVWLKPEFPAAAKVGIYRDGFKEPLYAIARFETYAQKNYNGEINYTWSKMPDLMISKCAEALALRKAFPQELSNIYSAEEMANFTEEEPTTKVIKETKQAENNSEVKTDFKTRVINYFLTLTDKDSLVKAFAEAKTRPAYKDLSFQDEMAIEDAYSLRLKSFEPEAEEITAEDLVTENIQEVFEVTEVEVMKGKKSK